MGHYGHDVDFSRLLLTIAEKAVITSVHAAFPIVVRHVDGPEMIQLKKQLIYARGPH